MAGEPVYPVTEIRSILRACRADEPLQPDDPRRHEFAMLRDNYAIVTELADTLEQQLAAGRFHHRLLCGHRGSGKSTELLSLKEWADANGFLAVWVEVDLFFGLAELQFSDLYLLTAERVSEAMEGFGSPLPGAKLEKVVLWFAEVTKETIEDIKSELELKAGVELDSRAFTGLLGKLFARFSAGVKAGSEHHNRIRQTLRQAPNIIIDLTNDLLRAANQQLAQKQRPNGLLLLFDNLDRYPPEAIEALLLRGATLISLMACHAVFTMPINLHYDPRGTYWDEYGGPAAILPMLSLREPSQRWKASVADSAFQDAAVEEMLSALRLRIDVERLFQVPEDARLLVKMSGGCMRDLLHLVVLARQKSRASLAEPLTQVTPEGVRRAITEYRLTLTEGLQEADCQRLAAIAQRDPAAQALDKPLLQLLARRLALRYRSQENRWTDVHPLVIETEGFQRALAAFSRITGG